MQSTKNRVTLIGITAGLVWSLLIGTSTSAIAIPAFAKKYKADCTMCHSNFPRLNDFGTVYRRNGYKLPGHEKEELSTLKEVMPVSIIVKANASSASGDTRTYWSGRLDAASGGYLGGNLGFFAVIPTYSDNNAYAITAHVPNRASIVITNLHSTWLNLRAGQFEPAYIPFSLERRIGTLPYLVYRFARVGDNYESSFASAQTGIEFYGYGASGIEYAAGCINASDGEYVKNAGLGFYVRGTKTFGRGEGQTSGQRIGITGLFGRAQVQYTDYNYTIEFPAGNYSRIGADASLNSGKWNLALQYLQIIDDSEISPWIDDTSYPGGFAELSYRPSNNVVGYLGYDYVHKPDSDQYIYDGFREVCYTLGGRYYFRNNCAFSVGYSRYSFDSWDTSDSTNNLSAGIDLAF
ncbi:MAG: hypothetical protein ABFD54_00250 [Armatimonadota bacterium]|nr:OprO/OprP family phosphate-selective porin [bacterium]